MELYLPPKFVLEKQNHDKTTGRFVKGMRPWNKGKKGINIGGQKTQFKRGHLPHNTKADGVITQRIDKSGREYKFIRISKGKWELLHRYLYKQKYGEIPKGYIVVFKDGNTKNCVIENLELITRAENLKRNYNKEKAARTLKDTWQKDKLRQKYGLPTKTKWLNKAM